MPLSVDELEKKLKEIKFKRQIHQQQKEYKELLENQLEEKDLKLLKILKGEKK